MKQPVMLALLLLFGCSADETEESASKSTTRSSVEASVAPEPKPNSKAAPSDWKEGLPAGPARAKVGETVLVVRPIFDWSARLEFATVKSIDGEMVTLSAKYGQTLTGLPNALIHPAAAFTSKQPFEVGQAVRSIGGLVNGVTRISKIDGDRVSVQGMFMKDVREIRPDFVMAFPPKGTYLFRRLRFKNRHGAALGLCLAESDKWVWLRDHSGRMIRVEKDEVSDLPEPAGGFAAGDVVETYTWVNGFKKGRVLEVLNDGLRYKVAIEGRKEPVTIYFADVLRKL